MANSCPRSFPKYSCTSTTFPKEPLPSTRSIGRNIWTLGLARSSTCCWAPPLPLSQSTRFAAVAAYAASAVAPLCDSGCYCAEVPAGIAATLARSSSAASASSTPAAAAAAWCRSICRCSGPKVDDTRMERRRVSDVEARALAPHVHLVVDGRNRGELLHRVLGLVRRRIGARPVHDFKKTAGPKIECWCWPLGAACGTAAMGYAGWAVLRAENECRKQHQQS